MDEDFKYWLALANKLNLRLVGYTNRVCCLVEAGRSTTEIPYEIAEAIMKGKRKDE